MNLYATSVVTAVAYDAAQRGLSVALVEAADFGSGVSWNSLKTIHGGLRHLQRDAQQAWPVRGRVGAVAQLGRQGVALDEFHGEEGAVAEVAEQE